MHGHYRRCLSPCCVCLPFQPPKHFATTHLRVIGSDLGACPGQVGHRASVLGKDHPCRRVYFSTAEGHGMACLHQGVEHFKMYELSSSWTSLWLQFCHCFGGIVVWI